MQSNAIRKTDSLSDAREICEYLPFASYSGALDVYRELEYADPYVIAQVGLHDRFFFFTEILRCDFVFRTHRPEWIYERCREVEAEPDGCLDLWAREHFKSTLITFAGSLQEAAKDSAIYQDLNPPDAFFRGPGQEITIGLFSHNTKIARDFLHTIKREMETNTMLPALYPDVFWQDPKREASMWSRDDGLILKRKSNPNEPTFFGWGLVDGLPTSKHFKLMVFDDTVTEKSVTTSEMIIKTTTAWELADYLGSRIEGLDRVRKWHIGTRYNYADTYHTMLDRKSVKPRIHPATEDGTVDGKPVFLSETQWEQKKRDVALSTLACQMLQNPLAGSLTEFKPEWLRKWEVRPLTLNVAILVDPASSKKKGSSNTAMAVIGMDAHFNKYLLDGAYHKMNLSERWTMLKHLRFKWVKQQGIQIVKVGYERYGLQADIEHFQEMMQIQKCPFPIDEVNWPRESTSEAKDDRIRRLVPDHQNWRFFYPYDGDPTKDQRQAVDMGKPYLVSKPIKRKDEDGKVYDLVKKFVQNEYLFFPATTMKDFMDAMSRFYDLDMQPPLVVKDEDVLPEVMED